MLDTPAGMHHFRDPKVWRQDGAWWMVVGARDGDIGQVRLYRSADLREWQDAGVLAVTTPSDDYVEFRSPTKDIAGNITSFDYGYGPNVQTTLKAGDYIVFSEKGDVESETPVTIKAGERFELTITPPKAGGKKK